MTRGTLEVKDLTVRYGGVTAVDGVTLDVQAGSCVGLIGPNGAGKTTLIDAMSGLTRSTGQVWLNGARIDRHPAYRRSRLGLVRTFQSLELFEELTVRENLMAAANRPRWFSPFTDLLWPAPNTSASRRVEVTLETLGLTGVAERIVADLSLGQRKLVTIARALALGPDVALLDEPAAGLASYETADLGRTLREVVDRGTTVLMIDHDMGLVLGVCDIVHVLEFGRVIASGTPDQIRGDDRVLRAYLGAEPENDPASEGGLR